MNYSFQKYNMNNSINSPYYINNYSIKINQFFFLHWFKKPFHNFKKCSIYLLHCFIILYINYFYLKFFTLHKGIQKKNNFYFIFLISLISSGNVSSTKWNLSLKIIYLELGNLFLKSCKSVKGTIVSSLLW